LTKIFSHTNYIIQNTQTMINSSIFKSYDVRGTYPDQLNEVAGYQIGQAFIKHTSAKKVVVGYDARLSSPALFLALCEGLISKDAQVCSIGQIPTECLYFALATGDFDAGIMITASHNPKEYNGFKMITKNGKDLNIVRGLDLLPKIEESEFKTTNIEIPQKDIIEEYTKYVFGLFDFSTIKKFKIVVDTSNGVMGNVLSKVSLPVDVIALNFQPDGNFPNHAPNPLESGSSDQTKEAIKQHSADFGFIFDADADRIFLVDENGKMVPADIVLALLAKYFLQKNPGSGVAYNAICSKSVAELVTKWGGVPVRTKVGAVNVRDGLLHHNGVIGGEVSAHYCFRDYFYMDSGLIALLAMLQIISSDGRKVSEIIKELSLYYKTDDNFKVADKDAILEKIKTKYADGAQDFLDGVTIEYKDWWFNVRGSNTEPLLRLTIEADTQALLDEKKKELSKLIVS